MRALVTSPQAAPRLARARAFLEAQPADADVVVLAATREAAAELVRSLRRPMFGWRRATVFRFAVELVRPALLDEGLALATPAALEALWARVVFELNEANESGRLRPVSGRPGLATALGGTVAELRLADVDATRLEPTLANAMRRFEAALAEARLVDRAEVLRRAAVLARSLTTPALLLLDVPVAGGLEDDFVSALVAGASSVLAVAPSGDRRSVVRLSRALGVDVEALPTQAPGALGALHAHLFSDGHAEPPLRLDDVFSAPGEARECVEIARRVLQAARDGVPFDAMAVLLRSPQSYRAPMEEALRRAGIPAWFAQGVTRPEPSGRAFLALLDCAAAGLSARHFAEYLSLGQVPRGDDGAPPHATPPQLQPLSDDTLAPPDEGASPAAGEEAQTLDPDAAVTAGRLRAPRRWERLINDAAVIGGTGRWRRRLSGLRARTRREAVDPSATRAQVQRAERSLADLDALEAFALPLLDELAALPDEAPWGAWLARLSSLATRALRAPARVLGVLQELAVLASVGPVRLAEVRAVLAPRLGALAEPSTGRRAGHLFVAPIEAARGSSFDVVFVPGLAERVFPQKLRQDPLLSDDVRRGLSEHLETEDERLLAERLALQLAVGAASVRAELSWPRLDAEQARPRVPSFYVLEAARAVEGSLLAFEVLQQRAERDGGARLAWPAPVEPERAIDEAEYDLSILREVLRRPDDAAGRARYLVDANPHLSRALRARYARRNQLGWTSADGLVRPGAAAREALAAHRVGQRPFSPTALELYAQCPYKFYLSTVLRLSPLEVPGELEVLGPLEKGSMAHEVQFKLLSGLRDEGLRLTPESLPRAFARLDEVLSRVTQETYDDLVPAIERVWLDGVESLRADLREWLRRAAADEEWAPWRFELAFGLSSREARDPASVDAPVTLGQGLQVRGSIDLVERRADGTLRATDYKTGRAWAEGDNVIGGGRHLQPVLYALVLEKLFPDLKVQGGRLYYCSQAGGYAQVPTALDAYARESFDFAIRTIASALEEAFLPAAPEPGACEWCHFRPVCGPDEEQRTRRKQQREETKPLLALRRRP